MAGNRDLRKPRFAPMMRPPTHLKARVDDWNAKWPVGTDVRFRKDSGEIVLTKTRTKAEVLSGHSAVIWLEGVSGCYDLARVKPRTPWFRWERQESGGIFAYSGEVIIGIVTTLPVMRAVGDGGVTHAWQLSAVSTRLVETRGETASEESAQAALKQNWTDFLEVCGLQEKVGGGAEI